MGLKNEKLYRDSLARSEEWMLSQMNPDGTVNPVEKGAIGYYFVDIASLDDTRECLIEAGLDARFVECGIVEYPPLPTFAE